MGQWDTRKTPVSLQAAERELLQSRSEDAAANYWPAASLTETMTTNIVGSGLRPTANLQPDLLGISKEQAKRIGRDMERAFKRWTKYAHVSGNLHFNDLLNLNLRTVFVHGEMLNLPVWITDDKSRPFSTALQDLHPKRLKTPVGLELKPNLHDGIQFTDYGRPTHYYISNPPAYGFHGGELGVENFIVREAKLHHRKNVFHSFRALYPEQVRGESQYSPVLKYFKHLDTSVDYELLAQILAASMPVFIETEDKDGIFRRQAAANQGYYEGFGKQFHTSLDGGNILYGNIGEKPHMLDNRHPSSNFNGFVELILRACAATSGMPYEIISKDFSKTNYSSARAALQEAWRVFKMYRKWLADHFCSAIWSLVIEEAVLRGYVKIPANAKPFFQNIDLWCDVSWIGDAQGYINPLQETAAQIKAIENGLTTNKAVAAERGEDWDEKLRQLEEEEEHYIKFFKVKNPEARGLPSAEKQALPTATEGKKQ